MAKHHKLPLEHSYFLQSSIKKLALLQDEYTLLREPHAPAGLIIFLILFIGNILNHKEIYPVVDTLPAVGVLYFGFFYFYSRKRRNGILTETIELEKELQEKGYRASYHFAKFEKVVSDHVMGLRI